MGSGGSGLFKSGGGGGSGGRGFEVAGPGREGNAISLGPWCWLGTSVCSGMFRDRDPDILGYVAVLCRRRVVNDYRELGRYRHARVDFQKCCPQWDAEDGQTMHETLCAFVICL